MADQLTRDLTAMLGRDNVLCEPDELLVYECDGLPQHKHRPRAVVFPRSTEEVSAVVRALVRAGVPFAPRGAGTGLSGGAVMRDKGGVTIEMARMRRLLELDTVNRTATVQTGFVNAQLSRAAAPHKLFYAPDPSSQVTCTIGGNVAENAGGIHCLKYGMTVDHVLAARVVLADGSVIDLGGPSSSSPHADEYDLLGVFVGSEGTFGIATEATLKLTASPPAVRTLLADFTDVDRASRAVSAIIAEGFVPAALEMMDGATIRAVEASVFAAGMPLDAQAALLIELDGLEEGLDDEAERCAALCREHGARNVRSAADEYERKKLWAARKGAFGAMGRIAPDMMLQDAVVPRSRLPEVLAATYQAAARYDLKVANVFHAGDGNLHPFISFDARDAEQLKRVKEVGREIMETCVRVGGTISGEHGVGFDKSEYMSLIFSDDDLATMLKVRSAFDPVGLCNPGKIIPVLRSCGEARRVPTNFDESNGDDATPIRPPAVFVPRPAVASSDSRSLEAAASVAVATTSNGRARALLSSLLPATSFLQDDESRATVFPASVAEAREVLLAARGEKWPIEFVGAGLRGIDRLRPGLDAFRLRVSSANLIGAVEHQPADLIATAGAGITLDEFNRELGRANQWLPLDVPGGGRSTLGGVAATGLGGAQSYGYGAPRSHVIGLRALLADGTAIKGGGRVVKNVAGYDLCKLFVGSGGTLGLITELTFKLRPLPARRATIVVRDSSLASLTDLSRRAHALLPIAMELLSPSAAHVLTGELPVNSSAEKDYALLLRFAGAPLAVAAQCERIGEEISGAKIRRDFEVVESDEELWRRVSELPLNFRAGHVKWRVHVKPAALAEVVARFESQCAAPNLFWHAGAGDGRARFIVDDASEGPDVWAQRLSSFARLAAQDRGSLVVEEIPESWDERARGQLRRALASEDPVRTSLIRRLKQQLDPEGTLPSPVN